MSSFCYSKSLTASGAAKGGQRERSEGAGGLGGARRIVTELLREGETLEATAGETAQRFFPDDQDKPLKIRDLDEGIQAIPRKTKPYANGFQARPRHMQIRRPRLRAPEPSSCARSAGNGATNY